MQRGNKDPIWADSAPEDKGNSLSAYQGKQFLIAALRTCRIQVNSLLCHHCVQSDFFLTQVPCAIKRFVLLDAEWNDPTIL